MAAGSGIAAQLGMKAEVTWGTAVVVDTFVPIVSDGLTVSIPRMESAGILAGRNFLTSDQWCAGNKEVGGDLGLELPTNSAIIRLLLEHMFGAVSGAGPFTYTPADLFGKGLTIQVGVPGVAGTVAAKTYEGCKFDTWEIAWSAGEIVTLGLGVIAEDEATGTSLAAASYASGAAVPFCFAGATATVGGSAVSVKSGTLACANNLERRYFGGSRLTAQPIATNLRELTGTLTLEFTDMTQYARFVNGTEAAVVVTFVGPSTTQLVITMNCRFDGATPQVGGRGIIEQTLEFKAMASTTDASAVTAVYTA